MPLGNWNVEWANLNSQRKYPLADDATGLDTTETFRIPDDFLVELDLPIHAGLAMEPARFFIRHIGAYATGYSVVVGYQPEEGAAVNVATALIDRAGHTRNRLYDLGGIAPYDDVRGKLAVGSLGNIDEQPPGFMTFGLEEARLEPDCIRPMLRGVSALYVVNGEQRSVPIYGDIELVAGSNVQLVPVLVSGQDPQIKINFVAGEGTIEECVCDDEVADPIRTINGAEPTAAGDFSLLGDDCIEVTPVSGGVRLTNTCAKPCCHCVELERITEDLQRLNQQASNVSDFASRLQTSVDTMDSVVLSSRLRDKGCVSC